MKQKKLIKPYSEATGMPGCDSKTTTQKLHFTCHCSPIEISHAFLVPFFSGYHRRQSFQNSDHSLSSYDSLSKSPLKWGRDLSACAIQSQNSSSVALPPTYLLTAWVLKSTFYKAWEPHSLLIKWTTHKNSFYFVWFSPNHAYYFQCAFTGPAWNAHPSLFCLPWF